ncbi:hypothetical protein LTR85_004439 [Meristemomyces frigidus]|nr:hypothetical protein LTR85_004439 [Meristemomyces frigidus]
MTSQEPTTTPQQPDVPASSDTTVPSSPAPVHPDPETAASKQSEGEKPTEPTPPPNPRLAAIAAKRTALEATLSTLQAKRTALVAEAKLPSGLAMPADWSDEQNTKQALSTANAVIKEHIALLHKYNEMKDVGQGLMGLIADKRGVRVGTVMEEFEMGEKD